MTNDGIIEIVKETCLIQNLIVDCLGNTLLKCKDEDFKKKIEQLLANLDCDGTKDDVRLGYRIFARELLKILDK